MAYEYIAAIIVGVVLIAIGLKLNIDSPIGQLVRLGLIIIGVAVFGILGLLPLFAQLK